ncbi:4'-phosphopantetheinyl transferase family protein [Roseateles sp.]|uniref:4'-phosphopantetheinyl transferase family protein n=1 Tax=Roseateles sp. TaxID=1971397 RepID=UPI0039E80CD5
MRLMPLPDPVAGEIEVHRLDLDLLIEPRDALALLSEDERARVARFVRRADRVRFARTRAALRQLLARRLDCAPAQVRIDRAPQGKPFAVNGPRFNASHAGAYALIAIGVGARIGEVGIDIESEDRALDMPALLPHAFSARECEELVAAPDPGAAALRRWVAKEAVLKAVGVGIADHLRAIAVRPGPGAALAVRGQPAAWGEVGAVAIAAPTGYQAALAWQWRE